MGQNLLDEQETETRPSFAEVGRPVKEFYSRSSIQRLATCLLLAVLAVLIHGYHPFSEDAAVYVPAIQKQLDPSLFPKGAEFFLAPARFSTFTQLVAQTVRLTHLPMAYALLGWYFASVFLLFLAAWRICTLCFSDPRAPWFGVFLLAAVLTVPIAGSSLLLSDPYLTSRSLCTPILLFAIASLLETKYLRSGVWLLLGILVHPLMAAYAAAFMLVLAAIQKQQWRVLISVGACVGIFMALLAFYGASIPVPPSYRAAVLTRTYFFLNNWTWYELVGIVAPLSIFCVLAWNRRVTPRSPMNNCAVATAIFGAFFTIVGLAVTYTPNLIMCARYQPMRSFHLVYVLMFILPVNLVLLRIFRDRSLAAVALFIAVCSLMFAVQRESYPATAHIQWPSSRSDNPWQQAFEWIRLHTPKDAVFALDADYMQNPQEDHQGFRPYAERSTLADRAKDGGVAALFPAISDEWLRESSVTSGLNEIERQPLSVLRTGATWFVGGRDVTGFYCPYRNSVLAVCTVSSDNVVAKQGQSTPVITRPAVPPRRAVR